MIVFISNFLNHHQLNICLELALKDKFTFIATMHVPQEQLNLGYENMNDKYEFVVRMYESKEKEALAQKLLNEADIVIASSCCFPFEMIKPRLEQNKLTFWFSERLFKRGFLEKFYPPKVKRVLSQCTKYRDNNFYLLCAGGYVAKDYAFYNAFKNKSFIWGYFPPVLRKDGIFNKKAGDKLSILWTARYLKWKHPEYAIKAAKILKKRGIDFEIKMLGNGKYYHRISKLIKKNNLENYVHQLGSVPAQAVRNYMNAADIFLFTSDRNEGWGAVLNESMNSACAVIACDKIGSVKSIIEDGKNGLLFKNKKQFEKQLLSVATNRNKIYEIGIDAYKTVTGLWSAEIAAARFWDTANCLLHNRSIPKYKKGPMTAVKFK